jgi:hypothetical protein
LLYLVSGIFGIYFDPTRTTTSSSNAPITEQGCAGIACHPDRRPGSAAANLGRIAPSICPDLVSDRDRDFNPLEWQLASLHQISIS